jgi:hypothetical protein
MPDTRFRKYYVDWWNIRKSTIYLVLIGSGLLVVLGLGTWWASRNNWFVPQESADFPKDAARIILFEGEVRVTRAATRETIIVTKPTYVAAGDTIQTMADGRATVQMIDQSIYVVQPNSAFIVKQTTSMFGRRDIQVSLDDGQLNVRTDEQSQETRNIIELADTENRLLANTDASFSADGGENAGEIRISRGGVETTAGGGKTVLGENEFAAIDSGRLAARERLLGPPRPISPGNGEQFPDQGGRGANITLVWQDPEGAAAANYHIQVSRLPTFSSDALMVDRSGMQQREYRLVGLTPATYYWRLKATARSGQTTAWNDAWKFGVTRGSGGIELSSVNVENVGGGVFLIKGRTAPGLAVRSNGRETFAGADGSFRLQINSTSSEAALELGDDRGNRSGFIIDLRGGGIVRRY